MCKVARVKFLALFFCCFFGFTLVLANLCMHILVYAKLPLAVSPRKLFLSPIVMKGLRKLKQSESIYCTNVWVSGGAREMLSLWSYPSFYRIITTPPWLGCHTIAGLPPSIMSPVPIYATG